MLKEEPAAQKPPLQVSRVASKHLPHAREAVVLLSNALVFSFSTSLTWDMTKAVAVRWAAALERSLWEAGQAAGLGKQGTPSCCGFDCSLSCDKAAELCSLPALVSRGEWRKHRWALSMMHEGLAFTRGRCLQSLSSKEGLLGAAVPVLSAFAPSYPAPRVCPTVAVRDRGLCTISRRAALSQRSLYI